MVESLNVNPNVMDSYLLAIYKQESCRKTLFNLTAMKIRLYRYESESRKSDFLLYGGLQHVAM
jgi:hypothetical protein